jgi:hypothetical protein
MLAAHHDRSSKKRPNKEVNCPSNEAPEKETLSCGSVVPRSIAVSDCPESYGSPKE